MLADLITGGLAETDKPVVLLSETEAEAPADEGFAWVERWQYVKDVGVEAQLPEDSTHVFVVLDGRMSPVDQLEGWKEWLESRNRGLARVICVVHCQLAEKNPKLVAWYEACIHFSDVVLLARRDGVPNKWISDFRGRFEKKFFPCLFEFVKEGRVSNPALILIPEARRMSHAFDEPEWFVDDEDDDEDEAEGEEEVEMKREEDPYFERRNGGRRVHELPDINAFLPPPA